MDIALRGIDIHTYLAKDPKRAIAFWRDTIGLRCTQSDDQGAEFGLPDRSTFGLWKMDDGSWLPGTGITFAVDDVAATAAALRAKGVTVAGHIGKTPVCFMGFAEDSEGNDFVSHQRKA